MKPADRPSGSDHISVPSLLLSTLVLGLGVAVAIPTLATLAFAAIGHPECATIPQDVGPCGYWARVAEFGPFIMLWGTLVTAGMAVAVWPMFSAVLGIFAARRARREQ